MVIVCPPPIMARIYTLISLIGCDELKAPTHLVFVLVHFYGFKEQNPIILWMGWTTIAHHD